MVGMRHIDDLPAADSLRAIFLGCAVLSPSTRDQQLTLRRIKRLAAAGNSPRKISSDLAERGVPLPGVPHDHSATNTATDPLFSPFGADFSLGATRIGHVGQLGTTPQALA